MASAAEASGGKLAGKSNTSPGVCPAPHPPLTVLLLPAWIASALKSLDATASGDDSEEVFEGDGGAGGGACASPLVAAVNNAAGDEDDDGASTKGSS